VRERLCQCACFVSELFFQSSNKILYTEYAQDGLLYKSIGTWTFVLEVMCEVLMALTMQNTVFWMWHHVFCSKSTSWRDLLLPLLELFCTEDVGSSRTVVNCYWSKWHHIPEDIFILSFETSVYSYIFMLKCILCGICSVISYVTIDSCMR
jgi:hypothetical protein